MEFNLVVGSRRSIRYFKTRQPVEEEKIQRILEAVRWTTCPGNLQPWRAIVVYRDELDDDTRDLLLRADKWQGAHVEALVWIYWFGDMAVARPDNFVRNTIELLGTGAGPGRAHAQGRGGERSRARPAPRGALSRTAAALDLHPNTVRHRLRRYSELTGADLERMEVLFELWGAIVWGGDAERTWAVGNEWSECPPPRPHYYPSHHLACCPFSGIIHASSDVTYGQAVTSLLHSDRLVKRRAPVDTTPLRDDIDAFEAHYGEGSMNTCRQCLILVKHRVAGAI